jgi:hypothetical protein
VSDRKPTQNKNIKTHCGNIRYIFNIFSGLSKVSLLLNGSVFQIRKILTYILIGFYVKIALYI